MYSLKHLNTFGVDIQAEHLHYIHHVDDILWCINNIQGPFKILGGGSNVLITKNIHDPILVNRIKGIEILEEEENEVLIRVGGGEIWHDLVLWAIKNNLGGIENLSLIPGTVGAAPIQNIGAYGVEQESVFCRLSAIDLASGQIREFDHRQCCFGYRDSVFKNEAKGKFFITSVVYKLNKKHSLELSYGSIREEIEKRGIKKPTIRDVSEIVSDIRTSKLPDPAVIGNGGSFFKNPIILKHQYEELKKKFENIPFYPYNNEMVKIPAGWLIDKGGWKGVRHGDVGTHKYQALVIVNHGNAKGTEIWNFANFLIKEVYNKYGIRLEPEVNIW